MLSSLMEKLNGENSIESVKWDFLKPFSIINRKKTLEMNLSKAMRVKWCRKVLCSVILKFWQTQETAWSDSKVQFGVEVSLRQITMAFRLQRYKRRHKY